ncbi:protein retinal degeneration B isoform X1 [Eupeodes corollae]|uniref:protein retinal degeneration B isoform X1 n=1 Tax=Eupeodes corollae TaxID=290404 RepID=UPI0024928A45|nr:protein retinal degeneration B isoform X1 [Eupeodes corollae]XP_055914996.1 protein retinal degeneration B isoform X1 [Eupeodes corollae]XP_055914997.1 protein retinal degeneration B isoform X1 [Eupeodes corollae]XP_055914998.1 protein retinal degeneration B isoform X1 [Eupeodes corollae]XP_055915000.1 protein retinal degeneration B isoform X1 [Eupeodes corollae]
MLIKEYRIPLPLTVDEYRIAQLYMIAKKSREESHGEGSGVEIIINEPYQDGPGGKGGQYTKKIYHVGSHLPGWIKSLLPKSALTVEEEAWNAYPFTKTRYTCPFVEKFSLDIETYYFPDNGFQENVFKLSGSELRNRIVDVIDIVKDQLYGADYVKEEDPKLFISEKTFRGPLNDDWLEEYWHEVKGKKQPTARNMSLMCAYKICRVEFRYWGMQTKLEKFIHDVALRKTMVRAHRQAWAWQDEWYGLTIEDIRKIEHQTQLALAKKMGAGESGEEEEEDDVSLSSDKDMDVDSQAGTKSNKKALPPPIVKESPPSVEASSEEDEDEEEEPGDNSSHSLQLSKSKYSSKGALHSPVGSAHSFDLQQHAKAVQHKNVANWRMERLEVDSKSNSEEEFFDCLDTNETNSLAKWSSLELLDEDDSPPAHGSHMDDSIFNQDFLQRVASERGTKRQLQQSASLDRSDHSPPGSPGTSCPTSILILVVHAGSVLDASSELTAKKSDVTTFRAAFESIMRQHYPSLLSHVTIKMVPCPSICTEALGILSSLSPYSFDSSPSAADIPNIADVPIGAIPLLSVASPEFLDTVNKTVAAANIVYHEFLKSEDGRGFSGQIAMLGDSMGSLLAYEALCRANGTNRDEDDRVVDIELDAKRLLVAPSPRRRRSSSSSDTRLPKLDFEVSDFFMFGTPLSIVLASRKLHDSRQNLVRPNCLQVYNMFHPTDPIASRLEPLLSARFSMLSPVNVPRYAKYPLGNGQPLHLLEIIQSHPQQFSDQLYSSRRLSDASMQSTISGLVENVSLSTISSLQQKWWGTKRLDYALYCPEGLSNFPAHALPHLFHASYWESSDVIAFILRQIGKFEGLPLVGFEDKDNLSFRPGQPREKWIKKRTSVKLKNVAANHRANDVIVQEGREQRLTARFMYGPLDMITLAGEKVDIHIMKDPPAGEWTYLTTEITDKTGRVAYSLPDDRSFGYGIYPIKMVVRGDHTSVDCYLAVVPPLTECVVFSIDGSFTASMSVTGRDPKVRAGAVDVCRHWQELGYLLIYITGRPDMQQQRVVSWLSQHNFPHGLISFADGLLTDPLGHKTSYLNNLVQNHGISICAAYGSSKDITVYTNVGLRASQIFIVGKVSKKLQGTATVLSEGYAAHLSSLMAVGGSRPAQGNARMVIPRGCFNLPGQVTNPRRRSKDKLLSSPSRSGYLKRKTYFSNV